ncbi:MAG TPA: SPFH domain-containing protein, partial [Candidatus Obscuribacter sp.]|nr:SPFH domain-containing protein [Candidatus Obscuribacter sp.]
MDSLISTVLNWVGIIVAGLFVLLLLKMTFFTVSNQTVKIIERFGKYKKTARAGLNIKIPLVDSVRATPSLQVLQHVVTVDTITKDKVSVKVAVAVQYQVIEGQEADAVYKLSNNGLKDIGPLMEHTKLKVLNLMKNKITDLSPL